MARAIRVVGSYALDFTAGKWRRATLHEVFMVRSRELARHFARHYETRSPFIKLALDAAARGGER